MSVELAGDLVETLQRIPMSYEDYLALPGRPHHEWVDGVVLVAAAPTPRHQLTTRRLAVVLEDSLEDLVVLDGVAVQMPGNRERVPDISVVEAMPDGRVITEAPQIVVEVLSPSTQQEDLLHKGPEYAEAGIGQFWVVDVDARIIDILHNVEGRWESLVAVDQEHPVVVVQVGQHGMVTVDLAAVLR